MDLCDPRDSLEVVHCAQGIKDWLDQERRLQRQLGMWSSVPLSRGCEGPDRESRGRFHSGGNWQDLWG